MKSLASKLTTVILVMLFVFVSCSKEQIETRSLEDDNISSLTIDEVVILANDLYLQTPESSAEEDREFFTENDGLIDAYTATEAAFNEKSHSNGFIRCLSGVGLDAEQSIQTRRALRAFEHRNERIIASHMQAFRQLTARANNARIDLLNQFQQGEIDRPELARRLNQLRENYRIALHELKVSNADAFSRSFRALMVNLNDIMTNRQWAAFTECLRAK